MERPNDSETFEYFLGRMEQDSPETVCALRTMSRQHGPSAALEALLLSMIARKSVENCVFSYVDVERQFVADHPVAVPMMYNVLSIAVRENPVVTEARPVRRANSEPRYFSIA